MAASLSACALPYYWQAVGGQIGLLRKRVPIGAVVDDPAYDPGTRERLGSVLALRQFAVSELKLPDNGSYSSYVDLGRPYVVWNVIATEEFSVEPERWCFPVAGCVAYRGYFDRAAAERFEQKLRAGGLDTYSGGSGAYSTLGYFDDPVLNTMLAGSDTDLASVLFHELAHQKLYVKDDSELSEAFATAIEEYGVERWLTHNEALEALDDYRSRRQRRHVFGSLVARQRENLRVLYARGLAPQALRRAKADAFAEFRAEYQRLKAQWDGADDFDGWFTNELNNATLVAIATYRQWLPGLRWRLDRVGLDAFYREVEALAELPAESRSARLDEWNMASASVAVAELCQVIR